MSEATTNVAGSPSAGTAPVLASSVLPVKPLKIKKLKICDFRAFAGPEPAEIDLAGKNLLVYGENGAGKSSIFHALNEFFSVEFSGAAERKARFLELRNRFSISPPANAYIEIELDDGHPAVRWSEARHPADIAPKSDPRILNGAYRKAIIDYRALLDTNYRHGNGPINLFDVCVNVLLRDYPCAHNGRQERLFDLWRTMTARLTRKRLLRSDLSEIATLAVDFNKGLREALDVLKPSIDELLVDLGRDDVKITALTTPGLVYNSSRSRNGRAFLGRTVSPELDFRTLTIATPQNFLNEARLSALALAIYFAGRKVCAATLQTDTPRLMVLDDVLIGLDQSNRLPVLQALEKHFSDWQIVLLTHDRVWYEMARFFLEDREDWKTLELFEETEPSGASRPVLRPQNIGAIASNIATARKFHAVHEYSAGAVHARVAFELVLKRLCERKSVPVRFRTDPRKLTTDELLTAVEAWLSEPARVAVAPLVQPAIAQIRMWRSVVLNQFSHSTPVNLTSAEVLGAIDAVEALHQVFQTNIK